MDEEYRTALKSGVRVAPNALPSQKQIRLASSFSAQKSKQGVQVRIIAPLTTNADVVDNAARIFLDWLKNKSRQAN